METTREQALPTCDSVAEATDVEGQTFQQRSLRTRLPAIVLGSTGLAIGASWLGSGAVRRRAHHMDHDSVVTLDFDEGVTFDDGVERDWSMGDPNWWNTKCPGDLNIEGLGTMKFVNAYYTTPHMQAGGSYADEEHQRHIEVSLSGRGYLGDSCEPQETDEVDPGWNAYDDVKYSRIKLLNKKLSYTMAFQGVGCGWDASLSLNAMPDNEERGGCNDYFCDSVKTCGVACTEISLQEANMYAWFSTLHTKDDERGVGVGYGGDYDMAPRRDWGSEKYGPGNKCIDTESPFRVSISFPTDSTGQLKSMDVELKSLSSGCTVSASIDKYPYHGNSDKMQEISEAMEKGMTLAFSLWGSPSNQWLDGKGSDGKGPCQPEDENPNTDTLADQDRVRWANFTVEDL